MTLVELLVVIFIIILVSVVALPTVLPALATRQVTATTDLLSGLIAGARDQAIHDGRPGGFRLLPDPTYPIQYTAAGVVDRTQPIGYARAIPIGAAPEYQEGRVSVFPAKDYSALTSLPCIILEQAVLDASGLPNAPTSWMWNIRVGDRVQINDAGPWYTVVGPMTIKGSSGNPDGFVNTGLPGSGTGLPPVTPLSPSGTEFLMLVNGRDDGAMIAAIAQNRPNVPDGWVDSGFDGVDNDNDPLHVVDNREEWEQETWLGPPQGFASVPYTIRRQPAPLPGARELALPSGMVVDASRSVLPFNTLTGGVEIQVMPDGTASPVLPYATPASLGLEAAWFHFALVDRADLAASPAAGTAPPPGPKGAWAVLSLSRAGRTVIAESPDPADPFRWALNGGH